MGCTQSSAQVAVEDGRSKSDHANDESQNASSIGSLRRSSLGQMKNSPKNENSSVYVKLCEQTALDFTRLMESTEGCAALAQYAAREHADENINFWIAAEGLLQLMECVWAGRGGHGKWAGRGGHGKR